MKRFLVFAFETFYPAGGMEDFEGHFDTDAEALACALATLTEDKAQYTHVFDQVEMRVVHAKKCIHGCITDYEFDM